MKERLTKLWCFLVRHKWVNPNLQWSDFQCKRCWIAYKEHPPTLPELIINEYDRIILEEWKYSNEEEQ